MNFIWSGRCLACVLQPLVPLWRYLQRVISAVWCFYVPPLYHIAVHVLLPPPAWVNAWKCTFLRLSYPPVITQVTPDV